MDWPDKRGLHLEFLLGLLRQLTNKIYVSLVLWVSPHNLVPNLFCKILMQGTKALAWLKMLAFRAFSFQVDGRRIFFVSSTDYSACHKNLKPMNTQNCKDLVGLMKENSHCYTFVVFLNFSSDWKMY